MAASYTQFVPASGFGVFHCPALREKFHVLRRGDFYEGCVGGDHNKGDDNLHYVWSKNGRVWNCAGVPVLARGARDQDPGVLFDGGTYFIATEVDDARIDVYESSDGTVAETLLWTLPGGASPVLFREPASSDYVLIFEGFAPFDTQGDIYIRRAPTLAGLASAPDVLLYKDPSGDLSVPDSIVFDSVAGLWHLYIHILNAAGTVSGAYVMSSSDFVTWTIPVLILPVQWTSPVVFTHENGDVSLIAWNRQTGLHGLFRGDDTPAPPAPAITVTIDGVPTEFPINGNPTFETGPSGIPNGAVVSNGDVWVDLGLTGNQFQAGWDISAHIRGPVPAIGPATGPWHLERASVFSWNHPSPDVGGVPLKLGAMAMKTGGSWKYADFGDPTNWNDYNLFRAVYDGAELRTWRNGVLVAQTTVGSPIDVAADVTMTLFRSSVTATNYWPGAIDNMLINLGAP